MDNKYGKLIIWAIILSVFFMGTVSASTWYVDDGGGAEFTRIGDAIGTASAGDTIIVKPGIYPEHLVVNKRVILKGEGYPIIDGEETDTVIWIKADRVYIEGLNVSRCDPSRWNTEAGIILNADNCVINNSIFTENNIGISTEGYDNKITNCKFLDNRIGIAIASCNRNTIKKSNFTKSSKETQFRTIGGIILDDADNNFITNNTFFELDIGITVYNRAEYNMIVNNTMQSNSWCAIEIVKSDFGPVSHNNKIYHNIFIDNPGFQAYDDGNNQWDNGAEGNYWSDYTGDDADEDGIGDTPYDNIGSYETWEKSGARDKYPLMEPIRTQDQLSDQAQIQSFTHTSGTVTPGSSGTASVTIKNTGSTTRSFWVGLSYKKQGATDWIAILPQQSESLSPGEFGTVQFSWTLTTELGTYDIFMKIWDRYDASTNEMIPPSYDEQVDTGAFSISDQPPSGEPGSSFDNPITIYKEGSVKNGLSEGESIYYKIWLNKGKTVTLTLKKTGGLLDYPNLDLYLYNPNREEVGTSTGENSDEQIEYSTGSGEGYYYVKNS
jgi:parallel beta-helix repeat protein